MHPGTRAYPGAPLGSVGFGCKHDQIERPAARESNGDEMAHDQGAHVSAWSQARLVQGIGTGSFRFVDPGSNHPITVWFCRTSTATPNTRIVFVMHGSDSQTARQACDLASPYMDVL